jgi:hypothetical protein
VGNAEKPFKPALAGDRFALQKFLSLSTIAQTTGDICPIADAMGYTLLPSPMAFCRIIYSKTIRRDSEHKNNFVRLLNTAIEKTFWLSGRGERDQNQKVTAF